jgi:ribose transport system permease protein
VRSWQVLMALYVLSGLIAALTGLLYLGMIRAPSLSLANPLLLPSAAAAVIGGTSIFGGRGSFAGAIVGALILHRDRDHADALADARGRAHRAVRADHPRVTALYVRFTDKPLKGGFHAKFPHRRHQFRPHAHGRPAPPRA